MSAPGRAQTAVRRVLVYGILFALIIVAAVGLSGLLERAVSGGVLAADEAGLARSLAFTVIGIPLAGVLWWWQRRRFADPAEQDSLVWALYVVAVSTIALVTATVALALTLTAAIEGRWDAGAFAVALVWAGVWVWHRAMRRSHVTGPTRLPTVAVTIGAVYGLAVLTVGAIGAVSALIGAALAGAQPVLGASQSWGIDALQALAWAAIGGFVWWWHWYRDGGAAASGGFAQVALVVVIGAAAATTLFAVGTVLFVVLRLLFDVDPRADVLAPLDVAIAAALFGGIVWVSHAAVVAARPEGVRRGARLLVSGIALIGAASGFGVVVNALLAALAPVIAGADARTLLLGGLSALAVGAPVWWVAWRPAVAASADEVADRARRVYLVAIFGASAVVAIVTLLVIGFRVFEFTLGAAVGGSLVERVRAPLGLLSATALVFGYHFAVWRHDRSIARPETAPAVIRRVLLVASPDAAQLRRDVRAATGAVVTILPTVPEDGGDALGDDDVPAVVAAVAGVAAPRALVLRVDGDVRAIGLQDGPARELGPAG